MSDDRLQRLIVHPVSTRGEITPSNLRDLLRRGLRPSRGRCPDFR